MKVLGGEEQVKNALILHKNRIVIIGPPNVGKSALFNKFANSYSVVANYPQTTADVVRSDTYLMGQSFEIIDTPGVSSLQVHSKDERATLNVLIYEHPEALLFCLNTARIKQGLTLLSQTLEFSTPTVLCLNMIDEAAQKGVMVDTDKLKEITGLPVVETAAIHGAGLSEVKTELANATAGIMGVRYPKKIEKAIEEIAALFPEKRAPRRGLLLLYLMDDKSAGEWLEERFASQINENARAIKESIHNQIPLVSLRFAVLKAHEMWADKVAEKVVTARGGPASKLARQAASISRHPVYGWPIFLAIMYLTFTGVAVIAPPIATIMETYLFLPVAVGIEAMSPNQFTVDFLVGDFGLYTMGVMNAIVTVAPILIVFFIILNTLEDVGYLPNVSVLTNRSLSRMGLSGKASLTLVLGFGCNTMATLTSRMLETKKERIIVSSLIALGVPCAVQLGVMIAILSAAPFSALVIVVGAVMVTQVVAGVALNKLVPASVAPEFIMELPQFRMPMWRHTFKKTYFRVKWFLVEAVPLFVLGAGLMFFLEKTGLLLLIKKFMAPVIVGFLSLPDKATEVFLLVLSRRELGAVYFKDMVEAGEADYYQIIVGLVVMTLFIPCVSNTMVMIKELGLAWAASINIGIMIVATLVGGLVNVLIRLF